MSKHFESILSFVFPCIIGIFHKMKFFWENLKINFWKNRWIVASRILDRNTSPTQCRNSIAGYRVNTKNWAPVNFLCHLKDGACSNPMIPKSRSLWFLRKFNLPKNVPHIQRVAEKNNFLMNCMEGLYIINHFNKQSCFLNF